MCHVLVIEDEFLIADHIGSLAEDAGATSVAYADTEHAAVSAALDQKPAIILSDVKLLAGTGPAAVATILSQLGPMPVIFITGTPEACRPCEPPAVIITKPVDTIQFEREFRRLMEAA